MDLGPLATELLRRLEAAPTAHGRFIGPPVDVTGLSPAELGVLWPAIHRALQAGASNRAAWSAATSIKQKAEELDLWPDLDAEACVATFRVVGVHAWCPALEQFRHVPSDIPPALTPELRRILGDREGWQEARYAATALARLIDAATEQEVRRTLCAYHQRSRVAPLIHDELVPQGEDLELQGGSRSEASAERGDEGEEDCLHEGSKLPHLSGPRHVLLA